MELEHFVVAQQLSALLSDGHELITPRSAALIAIELITIQPYSAGARTKLAAALELPVDETDIWLRGLVCRCIACELLSHDKGQADDPPAPADLTADLAILAAAWSGGRSSVGSHR